jgi:hypothetical protein
MRTYKVQRWSWNNNADKKKVGKISNFKVSDKYDYETDEERPAVADFEVNAVHDETSQKIRAEKLCSYLNDVNSKMNIYDTLTNTNIT